MRALNKQEVDRVIEILIRETMNPRSNYEGLIWFERDIDLDNITVDLQYIIQRPGPAEGYIIKLKEDIKLVGLLEPLIVTYDNFFLVDGYNRYQALRMLKQKNASVYHGIYPEKRVIWNVRKKCFLRTPELVV